MTVQSGDGQAAMRRADLRTACLLILLAIAMLAETTTFPMTDSYAGVKNVWYVSPALFPLIIGGLLLILALVLAGSAARHLGTAEALRQLVPPPRLGGERGLRFLLLLAAIIVFVYILVPRVDFVVAAAFFLLTLVQPFHLDRGQDLAAALFLSLVVALAVLLLAPLSEGGIWRPVDLATLAGLLALAGAGLLMTRRTPLFGRFLAGLAVAVAVPLVLAPIFRYGLLVPLPTEGLVIEAMHQFVYY